MEQNRACIRSDTPARFHQYYFILQSTSKYVYYVAMNEESIDEAAHEETVRRLEKLESVLECLEEALEALDD